MSNETRRIARRQRRDAKKKHNLMARTHSYDTLLDLNTLYRAAYEASKGVRWKTATQSYQMRVLSHIVDTRRKLSTGQSIIQPLKRFDLWERGKLRHIQAAKFPEKVVQKALTTRILRPLYVPTFTAGNSANMRGRGTSYAINRLKRQLVRHYRKHGRDGYILLCDFSDYFASIPHTGVLNQLSTYVTDRRTLWLASQLVNREDGTRGLGLGSEPSQVFAVAYPTIIEHWIEQNGGGEATGRYMDDLYIIDADKNRLRKILDVITAKSRVLGLTLNPRKTHIVKLSHGFTWLKKRWSITETGRIIIRPSRKAITRERRKLKRLAAKVIRGDMTLDAFRLAYKSWRGGLDHFDARRSQRAMDRLYSDLTARIESELSTNV